MGRGHGKLTWRITVSVVNGGDVEQKVLPLPHTLTSFTSLTRAPVGSTGPAAFQVTSGDLHGPTHDNRFTVATAIALTITNVVVQIIGTGSAAEGAKVKNKGYKGEHPAK